MQIKIQVFTIIVVLVLILFVFRLVIKRKLRAEYSIIWIIGSIILMVFSVWRDGLEILARLLGVYYAPALIFLVADLSIIIFLVHLSVVNSKHHEQIKKLAQEIALLKNKIETNNKE
jgi:hypothetical protein